jgi:hypothetical protein
MINKIGTAFIVIIYSVLETLRSDAEILTAHWRPPTAIYYLARHAYLKLERNKVSK